MSSDSSDDENLELLREAADKQFINDSMFNNIDKPRKDKTEQNAVLPSLRSMKDEHDQFSTLDVTPEFQEYVAKQLSNILEKEITESLGTQVVVNKPKKRKKGDIKLFTESGTRINLENGPKVRNKKPKLLRQNSEQNVDFRQIAVTVDDIQKEVKHWSTWSRSKVLSYKKLKNGKLEHIEPKFV